MATWGAGDHRGSHLKKSLVPIHGVERRILFIRGQRVMLDADLAILYGVSTRRLKEQVRRNRARFPEDFMFQLTRQELNILRSQIATSSWGGLRYRSFAFTEQGVAMLSSILRSPQAIRVNIEIMRAFVRLRGMVGAHRALAQRIEELERTVGRHDAGLGALFTAIKRLMAPAPAGRRRIGFLARGGGW